MEAQTKPQLYSKAILDIIERVEGLVNTSNVDWDFKASSNKWSKKELLGHLIDSAYNNHQRILRGTYKTDMNFDGYNQDEWVAANNYQARSIDEVFQLWKSCNEHFCALILNTDVAILERQTANHNLHEIGMWPVSEGQEVSLSYLIWDYIYHLDYHFLQIFPNYKAYNLPRPK